MLEKVWEKKLREIQVSNLVWALKAGQIDWFRYFELLRKIK